MAIEGTLISFGLNVIVQFAALHEVLEGMDQDVGSVSRSKNVPDGSFLLVCIVTEGTATTGGGLWWYEEPGHQYHDKLLSIYGNLFPERALETLITKFKRRTVLRLACGIGLHEGDLRGLQKWVERTDAFDELIAPTRLAFHPAQFLGFTTNLAVMLYFLAKDFSTSLAESWLRDERSREHADLLVLRQGRNLETLMWSPNNRPFGQYLRPCECHIRGRGRWRYDFKQQGAESFTTHFRCTICKAKLRFTVEIDDRFTRVEAVGTAYVRCPWPVPHIQTTAVTARMGSGPPNDLHD
ncbi:hypothetical protein BDV93DRAFT_565513 [Ceratobasidium sp. AG-I]|nr:hypothetical protein BDV93DRAFT_565513 [Ceratobasidium sp. AG-I]